MELDAVGVAAPAERLVGIRGRAREQDCALGQRERVAVPLERGELAREAGEDRVVGSGLGQEHRQEPDFRRRTRRRPRAPRLAARSCTPRHAPKNGRPARTASRSAPSRPKPGELVLVVDAHRAAHGDDGVELAPVRERLAFVELDAVDASRRARRGRPRRRPAARRRCAGGRGRSRSTRLHRHLDAVNGGALAHVGLLARVEHVDVRARPAPASASVPWASRRRRGERRPRA